LEFVKKKYGALPRYTAQQLIEELPPGIANPEVHWSDTGAEREETFWHRALDADAILTGGFGTLDNPVLVSSWLPSRIVGCQGGEGDSAHDLLWHEVRRVKPTVCLECGQVFKLRPTLHQQIAILQAKKPELLAMPGKKKA
jgi:hypothetical protein